MSWATTPAGERAYALLDQAFADPAQARRVAIEIGAMDGATPAEEQEIADAQRMAVKLMPGSSTAGLAVQLAAIDGHHVPGTAYNWRHGWVPITRGPGEAADDTKARYMRGDGTWEPARQRLHDKIIDSVFEGITPEEHPVATFLGGGTAAGKTSAFGEPRPNSVVIDPDALKQQLPEYGAMVRAGDSRAAMAVHEESSDISKRAVERAHREHLSYTLDAVGDGAPEKMIRKIDAARAAGFTTEGRYVTVDTDEALRRAKIRAQRTGRMVPETVLRQLHAGVSQVYPQIAGHFDRTELWDTSGGHPVRIAAGTRGSELQVADRPAYQRFLAKAQQT